MTNPEYEKKGYKDETGFSEKQLDVNIEIGVFTKRKIRKSPKKIVKKTIFEKKRSKML